MAVQQDAAPPEVTASEAASGGGQGPATRQALAAEDVPSDATPAVVLRDSPGGDSPSGEARIISTPAAAAVVPGATPRDSSGDQGRPASRRKTPRDGSGSLRASSGGLRVGSVGGTPRDAARAHLPAGRLCRGLPNYCRVPPVSCVVFGFGVSEDGQLGVDTDEPLLYPKVIESLLGTRLRGREFGASPLVGGSRNTMAIDADGQLLAWGWNARGTLGHGHRATERKPRYVSELRGVRIVQAAIGGWHCLAVDDQGQAYAFGGNEYAQATGEGGHDVVTPQPCLPHLRVTQVAAGGMHSVALTDSGEVWTWGEPWGDFSMEVNRSPRKVEGATDIAKIACGAFHNLLLSWKGEVFAWGINDFGQLGNGTTSYATSPVKVVGLEDLPIADISAGGWHSLALTTTGAVYVWGRGEYGRLGLGDKTGSSKLRPRLVESIQHEKVVQAVCGGTHTMVLTAEGRIYIWGRGSFGRLGMGGERDCPAPVSVSLPGGPSRWRVVSLCAGGRHSMVLAMPDSSAIEDIHSASSDEDEGDTGGNSSAVGGDLEVAGSLDLATLDGDPAGEVVSEPERLAPGFAPRRASEEDEVLGGSSDDDEKVGGSSDDEGKIYADQGLGGVGSAYVGEGRRMGGGDSPDGQRFRDSFSSAQHNLIERALASNDSRNLVSDE
mmetsp:Transcript_5358/g.15331  ORF Transcript_5358/g.15331 Transcript_5358/m.15331 type:complete len:664 (+) Transcript_5358:598-2589(+)